MVQYLDRARHFHGIWQEPETLLIHFCQMNALRN